MPFEYRHLVFCMDYCLYFASANITEDGPLYKSMEREFEIEKIFPNHELFICYVISTRTSD